MKFSEKLSAVLEAKNVDSKADCGLNGLFKKSGKNAEDFDQGQIAMGVEVESEHTDDSDVARQIALDHLTEIPDYYTRLAKMEKEAKAGNESE